MQLFRSGVTGQDMYASVASRLHLFLKAPVIIVELISFSFDDDDDDVLSQIPVGLNRDTDASSSTSSLSSAACSPIPRPASATTLFVESSVASDRDRRSREGAVGVGMQCVPTETLIAGAIPRYGFSLR